MQSVSINTRLFYFWACVYVWVGMQTSAKEVYTCVDVGVRLCLELCVYAKVPAGVSVDAGACWALCMGCACTWRGVHVRGGAYKQIYVLQG